MKTWNPYSSRVIAQFACITLLSGCIILVGCRKKNRNFAEPAQPAFLSIAEANWSNGSSQIVANSTPGPDSKAFNSGNGLSTQFSEGDRLGLFLRGDSYEPVDNRMVTYTPEEGDIITKWVIDGDPITLYQNEATLTAYFPYSEYGKLLMDSIPLVAGAYDVNTNDVVWQRDKVHSTHTQAMFLNMQHAMTRVKLIFSKAPATDPTTYLGAGKIEAVQIADANTVAEEDQVIYVDGFLNLETETPTILPAVRGRVIISATKTLSEEGVLYDFLLLPVATINPGAVQLHILIDDKTITTEFPTSLINAWKAGTAYTYEVTVRNGDSQVVFGKVGTTPWNYGGKISGDLDPSNPEYGGGDVEDWGNNGWGVEIDGPGSLEVSPDPTNIAYTGAEFTVAWTHVWNASVTLPVRVIEEGQGTVLSSGEVTSTSPEVKLTVPENASTNKERQISLQYQWNGEWKEFDRGTQAIKESIDISGTIEISSDPGSSVTWDNAITYCTDKGNGWRLPSKNELMYLWGLAPSFAGNTAFAANPYWSTTQVDDSDVWYVDFGLGFVFAYEKTNSYYVRCVKDKETTEQTYPYITTASDGGVVIVLQDENGGVDESVLFPNRLTASATGDEQSSDNRISRKFRVQKTQGQNITTHVEAVSYCDNLVEEDCDDWRLPSQRELQLICAMGGNNNVSEGYVNNTGVGNNPAPAISSSYLHEQESFTAFEEEYFVSATQSSSNSNNVFSVSFMSSNYGHTNAFPKDLLSMLNVYVRCVRDEW